MSERQNLPAMQRLQAVLVLLVFLLAYAASRSAGLGRILMGASAVGLALMLVLSHSQKRSGVLRWLAAGVGLVFVLAGIGLLVGGVFLIAAGSFGILVGLAVLPVGMGVGMWGYTLLITALNDPKR